MDTSTLIPLARLGDSWMRYIDKASGREIDCADFYRQYLAEIAG